MPQKTVILCEGEHDVALISLLLERTGKKVATRSWGDILHAGNRGETKVISEFSHSRRLRPYAYLVKQDNNIDTCIASFWELYQTYSGYSLKMVIDSDGDAGIRKIRETMKTALSRDVLLSGENANIQYFKDDSNKPAIFLYPCSAHPSGKLTEMVKDAGCGNLAGCRNADTRKEMLERYLATNPSWVRNLELFLVE